MGLRRPTRQVKARVDSLRGSADEAVLDFVYRVLRRHEPVGIWTPKHERGVLDDYENHDFNASDNRCLTDCVIPDAACGQCPGQEPYPCSDAADALALLDHLERSR